MTATLEWLPYTVRQGDTLETVLTRYGHIRGTADNPGLVQRVWLSELNVLLRQAAGRQPRELREGDELWLPPRDLPADQVLRELALSRTIYDLAAAAEYIRSHHGPESLEPSAVPLEQITPEYLYNLFENLGLARTHPGGPSTVLAAVSETGHSPEGVHFLVRVRRAVHRPVAPSGAIAGVVRNRVTSGVGAFDVRVTLDLANPVVAMISAAHTAFREAKCRFKVKITKRATALPVRTTVRVLQGDGRLYFERTYQEGPLLTEGEHPWEWDCFTSHEEAAELDTRILRGRLSIEVLVEAAQGIPGIGVLHCNNRPAELKCADYWVSLDRGQPTLELYAYMSFRKLSESWVMWVLVPLLMTLAVMIVEYALVGLFDVTLGNIEGWDVGEEEWNRLRAVAPIVGFATSFLAYLIFVSRTSLSDAQMAVLKRLMLEGIRKHWSRTGSRKVTVGSMDFQCFAEGVERQNDAVDYVFFKAVPALMLTRGCNLGTLIPGLPTIIPVTVENISGTSANDIFDRKHLICTGGHEFGHSTLRADKGFWYSMLHKGTSTILQAPSADAPTDDGTSELDLMKYYSTMDSDVHNRFFAVEDDILGILRTAKIEWIAEEGRR